MTEAPIIQIPENPQSQDLTARYLNSYDEARLRIATLPGLDEAKGSFLVVPGWAEYIEKYAEVAQELRGRSFNVMICDPRGQGYSHRVQEGDDRGLIDDFGKFSRDLDVVFDEFVRTFPPPHFILAHSMGGLITLEWLATGDRPLAGVVLSAPFTRLYPNPVRRFIVRTMVRTALFFNQGRRPITVHEEQSMDFDINKLTQDPQRHERFKRIQLAEPEAQAGHPRYAWVNAAMAAHARIDEPEALSKIEIPTLLVSADWDETVDPSHHAELAERYPNIELVRIPDSRHEILMELDPFRAKFWQSFDDYVERRLVEVAASANMPPDTSSATPDRQSSSRTSAN